MDHSNTLKKYVLEVNARNFNDAALEIFRYQAKNNAVYNQYLRLLDIDPVEVKSVEEIPFLPVELFKNHRVATGEWHEEAVFFSSGTTGSDRSSHFIKDLSFYQQVSSLIFERFYGKLQNHLILALLPSYLENKSSSLIYMINHFLGTAPSTAAGFIKDLQEVEPAVRKARKTGRQVIVWGVAFALLDLAEQFPQDLSEVIVMETGGMKGRRREITREELHGILKEKLNLKAVNSEYGMTEMLSQAYSHGEGIYSCPPWMKVLIRELQDPFSVKTSAGTGGINIIDLANVDSCAFIETRDIGIVYGENQFEIRGRSDNSDVRGCNLMYTL